MSTPVPPAAPDVALRSVHTSNLPALFDRLQISLVVSTYQAGKVIVIRSAGDTLNTHFRTFTKPMGLAADGARLTIGGTNTVWDYRNIPAVARTLDPPDQHDGVLRGLPWDLRLLVSGHRTRSRAAQGRSAPLSLAHGAVASAVDRRAVPLPSSGRFEPTRTWRIRAKLPVPGGSGSPDATPRSSERPPSRDGAKARAVAAAPLGQEDRRATWAASYEVGHGV
jgi:hypothetical protein